MIHAHSSAITLCLFSMNPRPPGADIAQIGTVNGDLGSNRCSELQRPTWRLDGAKLRLDGKLAGPWVCELKLQCEPILAKSERIQMDCGGVSSIDSNGIALMQILQAKGVTLVNCSPFIKLQSGQR